MARKCGVCRQEGHTKVTCPTGNAAKASCPHCHAEMAEAVLDIHVQDAHKELCTHPNGFTWADDDNGHSGSFCRDCGAGETTSEYALTDPSTYRTPVVPARFDSECDTCDGAIFEGDEIRADGKGGWECARHADEGDVSAPVPTVSSMDTQPDPFSDPTSPTPFIAMLSAEVGDLGTVADFTDPTPTQPKRQETDRRGYRAKDPTIGDFRRYKNGNIKQITRVSTFIKAGSDRTALTEWNERNVLLGAVHFPEIAAQAKALHPNPEGPLPEDKDTKQTLNRIVDQVSELVGSKRAANKGTEIHASLEKVGRGEATLDGIPTDHVPWVKAYLKALEDNGLELIPDLIERTVFVPQFGGVMGRFDQAVREIATGRVLLTDNKTGNIDYAFNEIEGQLAMYVAGYTQHGAYVWADREEDDRWEPPAYTMDATEGIVFHLPVKYGDPVCHVIRADLKRGWSHVDLCAKNREAANNKPKPEAWVPRTAPARMVEPAVTHIYDDGNGGVWGHPGAVAECGLPDCQPAPEPESWDWEARARTVKSRAEAMGLWESAFSAGVPKEGLDRLASVALQALSSVDTPEPPF